MSLTASLEDCGTRPYSEQLRLLFGEVWQNVENSFYTLLGKPVEWHMGQADNRYGLLRGLLDQEKVRLLYDGVRGGDSRCGDMLTELLTSGAVTREVLKQMSPNRSGVNDWPDTWYEEALERIEGQMARGRRKKKGLSSSKTLNRRTLIRKKTWFFQKMRHSIPLTSWGKARGTNKPAKRPEPGGGRGISAMSCCPRPLPGPGGRGRTYHRREIQHIKELLLWMMTRN